MGYLYDKIINLCVQSLGVVFHGHLVSILDLAEDIFYLPGPPHLVGGQHHHALIVVHPLHSGGGGTKCTEW